jgi:hypothetical protein
VCREACLSFHHLHLLSPFITPVQWSVDTPATSICLTSLSPLQRPGSSVSQNSPGHRSVLTPHLTSLDPSVPASLVLRHCLPGRVPHHDSPDLTPPCTTLLIPLPPVRRPLLFVDRRASRLDHLTQPPPSLTPTQPRLLYPPYLVQSIPSVCLFQIKR